MKTVADVRQILQGQKPYLAEQYGIAEISIFGSYVRGEQRTDSDLDVLIELERPARISLIDLVELELYGRRECRGGRPARCPRGRPLVPRGAPLRGLDLRARSARGAGRIR